MVEYLLEIRDDLIAWLRSLVILFIGLLAKSRNHQPKPSPIAVLSTGTF